MSIREELYSRALVAIELISEAALNLHHKEIGKMGIVDRIRGGHVQLRKKQSDEKGYKVLNGQIVKMTPEEMRHRKISARISARKRRAKEGQIERKRLISLKIRGNRLG